MWKSWFCTFPVYPFIGIGKLHSKIRKRLTNFWTYAVEFLAYCGFCRVTKQCIDPIDQLNNAPTNKLIIDHHADLIKLTTGCYRRYHVTDVTTLLPRYRPSINWPKQPCHQLAVMWQIIFFSSMGIWDLHIVSWVLLSGHALMMLV